MTDTTRDPLLDTESVVPVTTGATGDPEAPLGAPAKGEKARSLGSDAWNELRHRPMFWISGVLIVIFVLMAAVPAAVHQHRPVRRRSLQGARGAVRRRLVRPGRAGLRRLRPDHLRGSGLDHGRASSPRCSWRVFGSFVGIVAGYRSGWVDSVLSRIGEIFLGIPLFLGGILFLYVFPSDPLTTPFLVQVAKVALVLGLLGWPAIMRLMRSSVLQVKPNDYVQAARALGATPLRIINSHILPNSLASVIVVSTINLGAYISVEASLSYLGIGLQPPAISWGIQISEASGIGLIRAAPHMLFFPSLFLSLTVLAFIMLGDVVRDALDPKLR